MRGIFTDGDLRRALEKGIDLARAHGRRRDDAPARARIRAEALAVEAVQLMEAHKINQLLVVDARRRAGRRAQHARPLPRQGHLSGDAILAPDALARARRVRLMIFDVDGVLTDGRLWYGAGRRGAEGVPRFDGHGIKLLQQAGVQTAHHHRPRLAGGARRARASSASSTCCQGVDDKLPAFERCCAGCGLRPRTAATWATTWSTCRCSRAAASPARRTRRPRTVRARAHYVAAAPAGHGAAREVCEFVLRAQGKLGARAAGATIA